MNDILISALCIYAVTFIVASSRAFQMFRNIFRRVAFSLFKGTEMHNSFVHVANGHVVLETDKRDEEDVKEIGVGYDFISCRMCVGFWISMIASIEIGMATAFPAYALSYFLATQERQ